MTEEQIERAVEREIDRLDRSFMAGKFTQSEYDREMDHVRHWAEKQYTDLERARLYNLDSLRRQGRV